MGPVAGMNPGSVGVGWAQGTPGMDLASVFMVAGPVP